MSTIATVHSEAFSGVGQAALSVVVVEGPDAGRAARVDPTCVIGAEPGCDLVLTDERVSRQHTELRRVDGQVVVRDCQSRNGTFFEGSRVTEVAVGVGAVLKLGRSFVRIVPQSEPLEVAPSQARSFGAMVGESLAMRETFAVLELAARSAVTVLLEGETGVGKELAARAMHDSGPRSQAPFVALDGSALPENLVESELFGHRAGAFTGASERRAGAFVRADGGTLFLDELDSLSLPVQARLLRAVEEREVRAVGDDDARSVDVRLIGASRIDLSALVAEGRFRSDLYYRLSVLRVCIPPLRARREDIAPMVKVMLERRGLTDPGAIEGPALTRLFAHDWPGNARELRNVIDRAIALHPDVIRFEALPLKVGALTGAAEPLSVCTDRPFHQAKKDLVDAFERRYLSDLLARHEGNLSAAAREAELDRKHFRRLAVRHGLL